MFGDSSALGGFADYARLAGEADCSFIGRGALLYLYAG